MSVMKSLITLYTLISAWMASALGGVTVTSIAGDPYSRTHLYSVFPNVPNRLTPSGWTGVPSVVTCAVKSSVKFRGSQGFLYNHQSGLCSPLLWLEGPSSPGALSVLPGEGTLYLAGTWCTGSGFQLMELGTGELVCLRPFLKSYVNWQTARDSCASLNSYLVSVKTKPKLDLIKILVSHVNVWVGLCRAGHSGHKLTWEKDGEVLTDEQISAVFHPGEPNGNGSEGCVEYSTAFLGLNDIACINHWNYICEKDLPRLTG